VGQGVLRGGIRLSTKSSHHGNRGRNFIVTTAVAEEYDGFLVLGMGDDSAWKNWDKNCWIGSKCVV
jgi:hypothetical protein